MRILADFATPLAVAIMDQIARARKVGRHIDLWISGRRSPTLSQRTKNAKGWAPL